MRLRLIVWALIAHSTGFLAVAQDQPAAPTPPNRPPGQRAGQGRGWGGAAWLNGRGVAGTVSEVAADHFTIKTSLGETYTVHYSANTRMLKQPAQRRAQGAMRVPPQEIKAADIQVGDAIVAMGEVD